jgi:hypothetical protein
MKRPHWRSQLSAEGLEVTSHFRFRLRGSRGIAPEASLIPV